MSAAEMISDIPYREIEQFLYREARILDDEMFEEWLAMLHPDIHYWAPGVEARYRKDPAVGVREEAMAHFDDRLVDLQQRIARTASGVAWAEDPRTRTCRFVSNIEVEENGKDSYLARSNLMIVRNRNEREEHLLSARRTDEIVRTDDGLRLLKRTAVIGQVLLTFKNLNVFL